MQRNKMTTMAILGGILLGTLTASNASAADGVIEINQAALEAGGVTPADTPGQPITIGNSGSYRLTGNITVSNSALPAISITASDVTIDLAGFTIEGSGSSGDGDGIVALFGIENIEVKNGSIYNMSDNGIELGGDGSRAINIRARNNDGVGIFVGRQGLIRESSAISNGENGLEVRSQGIAIGNTARGNGDHGIRTAFGCSVSNNNSFGNSGHGFFVGGTSTIIGNHAGFNGDDGFHTFAGSLATDNTATGNDGFGLVFIDGSGAYSNNALSENDGGTVSGGVQIGLNFCESNTACP